MDEDRESPDELIVNPVPAASGGVGKRIVVLGVVLLAVIGFVIIKGFLGMNRRQAEVAAEASRRDKSVTASAPAEGVKKIQPGITPLRKPGTDPGAAGQGQTAATPPLEKKPIENPEV